MAEKKIVKSCPFCKIVNNNTRYSETILYKDELVTAFMDQVQPNKGHVLIIPNNHYKNIFEIDEAIAGHLFKVVVRIARAVKKSFKVDGINIYQCNGKHAAQMINHFHVHVFPRIKGDGLFEIYPDPKKIIKKDLEELIVLKEKIKRFL